MLKTTCFYVTQAKNLCYSSSETWYTLPIYCMSKIHVTQPLITFTHFINTIRHLLFAGNLLAMHKNNWQRLRNNMCTEMIHHNKQQMCYVFIFDSIGFSLIVFFNLFKYHFCFSFLLLSNHSKPYKIIFSSYSCFLMWVFSK